MKRIRKQLDIITEYCKQKNALIIQWVHHGNFKREEDFYSLRKLKKDIFEREVVRIEGSFNGDLLDGMIEITGESTEDAAKFFEQVFQSEELESSSIYAILIGPDGPITENT